jgi:hypothetical protein
MAPWKLRGFRAYSGAPRTRLFYLTTLTAYWLLLLGAELPVVCSYVLYLAFAALPPGGFEELGGRDWLESW